MSNNPEKGSSCPQDSSGSWERTPQDGARKRNTDTSSSGTGTSSRIRRFLKSGGRAHSTRDDTEENGRVKTKIVDFSGFTRGGRPSSSKSTSSLLDVQSPTTDGATTSNSCTPHKPKTKVGSWAFKFCKKNTSSKSTNSSPSKSVSSLQNQAMACSSLSTSLIAAEAVAAEGEVLCVCCAGSSNREGQQASTPNATRRRMATAIINQLSLEEYTLNSDDMDERARMERAREIAEGVDPPPGFIRAHEVIPDDIAMALRNLNLDALPWDVLGRIWDLNPTPHTVVHTTVDYMHCLVPDLHQISKCGFYWGKMDRYEAEKLLEKKPEGSFLLRDSAQEEYLFSVSFRRYGRSLHARIEQWNHKFSFDSHDPGVYSSPTVCGLIEHYKDPACCMYFEPMLTLPINRTYPFSLQHLARCAITANTGYDSISKLNLPKPLKCYLREYHYKQRLRVRNFE